VDVEVVRLQDLEVECLVLDLVLAEVAVEEVLRAGGGGARGAQERRERDDAGRATRRP
jgi:hypothetical protein